MCSGEADYDKNMEIVSGKDHEYPALRANFYKDSDLQEVLVEHEWYLEGHE